MKFTKRIITNQTLNLSDADFSEGEIILIDKPSGPTSFQVVSKIRKITGVKKVGHSAKRVAAYIDLQKQRAVDKSRIALSQAYEVRSWSKKFKVTPARLKAAVKAAGHSAKKVGAYLAAGKKTVAKKKKTKRKKARL